MVGISIFLILFTGVFSYRGFIDHRFFDKYEFNVKGILARREYIRLVSSGFLHLGWTHLLLNMLSLVFFSGPAESLGVLPFLAIYFGSMLGGNLLALFIHRHHPSYTAVGASGAVSGVIFAAVAVWPGMDIQFFLIPLPIPAWLYGLAYVLLSIYGIRSKSDNIGHEAHLGGAILGMLIALAIVPSALSENLPTILLIGLPALLFIFIIVFRPHLLLIDNFFYKKQQRDFYSIDHKYNAEKRNLQHEIDRILDKINQKGIQSLSDKERAILKRYSEGN